MLTTTNGTRALLRAAEADRVLVAAFVNYSAVCEALHRDERPVHIVCAGTEGKVTLEDAVLAGALVDYLAQAGDVCLNDGPAWPGTVSRITAGFCKEPWRSVTAAPICGNSGMMRTFAWRPRSIDLRWCPNCGAIRCASRSGR